MKAARFQLHDPTEMGCIQSCILWDKTFLYIRQVDAHARFSSIEYAMKSDNQDGT